MADLLVIVPSRNRPQSVPRLLDAWDATGAWEHAALLFAVDCDDPTIDIYRRHAADREGDGKLWWLGESPTWRPMVHKLDLVATTEIRDYPVVGFAGDDHLPRTPGWVDRYLHELADLGTGIVYGDDGYQGERLPTQWAMTADIIRTLDRMVPAPVEHLYCDNSVLDLGRAADCIRYLPDVLIEHMHPVAGKADSDDQYRRVNGRDQYARDRRTYQRWRRSGLHADTAAVRRLRGDTHA
ncbi:hypothetical protein [Micromonospora sp. NPDC049891]|uniref:hypothetical protein n=1 Tax=Micromonospora sp. NPDC049891 TaxID=3155655 RepID=UPI0033EF31B3